MTKFTALVFLLLPMMLSAQKSKITTANFALDEGDLPTAKTAIEEAVKHEKTATDPKGWYIYGEVYWKIYLAGVDSSRYWNLDPQPLEKARTGYLNAVEFGGPDNTHAKLARSLGMQNIYAGYYNEGNNLRVKEDFEGAFKAYGKSMEAKTHVVEATGGAIDTVLIFYHGYCAQKTDRTEMAIETYERLADMGFKEELLYSFLSGLYREAGEYDKALRAVNRGLQLFPKSSDLIIGKLNVYLANDQQAEAVTEFEEAARLEPENVDILYALGTIYDALRDSADSKGKTEDAEALRVKTIATYVSVINLDPKHHGAHYNMGVLYFNEAMKIVKQMNELPRGADAEYQRLNALRESTLRKGLPFLEKAHEIKPDDDGTVRALREVYVRLSMYEEANQLVGGE